MSAEILRSAAEAIRSDHGPEPDVFFVAVTEWLDNFAHHWDLGDYSIDETTAALNVARAYLGATADIGSDGLTDRERRDSLAQFEQGVGRRRTTHGESAAVSPVRVSAVTRAEES